MDEILQQIYKNQRKEVDDLYGELCDLMEVLKQKEENGSTVLFSEMRELWIKFYQFSEAEIALDNIVDPVFGYKEDN